MSVKFKQLLTVFVFVMTLCIDTTQSFAAKKTKPKCPSINRIQTSLVVDATTGRVLHAENQDVKVYPASLAKGMTLYMLFEAISTGKFSLDSYFYVSHNATKALPSKLYLQAGERIKVRDAIVALVVKSANDVAYTIAENIGGSEKNFIKLMNKRASALGMKNTHFANASGWHDPKQVSTAVDMAKLYMALKRDFPQYYHFCSKTSFTYKNKTISGHNRVMANYPGATGGKTGFTNPAGFNLVIEASRNGKNLIGVVTGSPSWAVRDKKMVNLLDEHFGVNKNTIKTQKSKPKFKLASNKI